MTRTSLPRSSRTRPGISLVEMLVVLAIIGVLAAMGTAVVTAAMGFADNLRAEVDAAKMKLRYSRSTPVRSAAAAKSKYIADQYLVILADSSNPAAVAARLQLTMPLKVLNTYETTAKGFLVSVPASYVPAIVQDSEVRFVEQDQYMVPCQAAGQIIPMGVSRIGGGSPSSRTAGTNVSITGTGVSTENTTLSGNGTGTPIVLPNTTPMAGLPFAITTTGPATVSSTRPTIGFPFFANNNMVTNLATAGATVVTSKPGGGITNAGTQLFPGAPVGQTINTTGTNVNLVIIDTGVARHRDLNIIESKSQQITNAATNATGPNNFVDTHGHGTMMAGIAAARDNNLDVVGVAPGALIWACNCTSTLANEDGVAALSSVKNAVDALTMIRLTAATEFDKPHVAFIGFTTGTGPAATSALNMSIVNLVNAGTVVVVPAGNGNPNGGDAGMVIPANCSRAITVAAFVDLNGTDGAGTSLIPNNPVPPGFPLAGTTNFTNDPTAGTTNIAGTFVYASPNGEEQIARFSNRNAGTNFVDLIAPGVEIQTTTGTAGVGRCTGTSAAAAHVAGLVALALDPDARMSQNIVNGRSIFNSLGFGNQTAILPDTVEFLSTNFHPYRSIDELFSGTGTMNPGTFPNNGTISGIPVANTRLY